MRVNPKSLVVAGLVSVGSVMAAGTVAGAQESEVYVTDPPPEVLTEIELPPEEPTLVQPERAPGAQVQGAQEPLVAGVQVQADGLALTGGDAVGLALIGGVAVAGGAGLLIVRRRSSTA